MKPASSSPSPSTEGQPSLERTIGLPGAMLMGLGSILGTGVFVSIGIAAGITGPSVILAVALAALVATCNALSSAQLAASHPVSGGTYEYGYRYLGPAFGFVAGWLFLCAKSASAATAALGFAGYLLHALGRSEPRWRILLGLGALILLTALVAGGVRRSSRVNAVIVGSTLAALVAFVLAGLPMAISHGLGPYQPFFAPDSERLSSLFQATALMFVAFTGYGRIATLGEEVRAPETTIPRAIVATLGVSMILYIAIAAVAVGAVGTPAFAHATHEEAAPLEVVARRFDVPAVAWLVALGAITAMLGVLLNLILGLSRVALAMGRRRDLPGWLGELQVSPASAGASATPRRAVLVVGMLIAALVLVGDIETAWSFSAFTVLVYYAITNLAALRLPRDARRYPRWIAALGLMSCLVLAFRVDTRVWLAGLGLIAMGLVWHLMARRRQALLAEHAIVPEGRGHGAKRPR